jgi:hypothetical protein
MKNTHTARISHLYDYDPLVLLNLRRLPARVNYRGASALLNFESISIRTLVALGLLKPLGNPSSTEHKYFATRTLLRLSDDEKWLHDATSALMKHWAGKNARRGTSCAEASASQLQPQKSKRPE